MARGAGEARRALDQFRVSEGLTLTGRPSPDDVSEMKRFQAALAPSRDAPEATPAAVDEAAGEVSIVALRAVDRGSTFNVTWTGSTYNAGVAIVSVGADAAGAAPVAVNAPNRPGIYDLAVVDADTGQVLGRRTLEVR